METHSIDLSVAHLGFKELLSGLAAALTTLFTLSTLPSLLAEAAAERPEIAAASGSLSASAQSRVSSLPTLLFLRPPAANP